MFNGVEKPKEDEANSLSVGGVVKGILDNKESEIEERKVPEEEKIKESFSLDSDDDAFGESNDHFIDEESKSKEEILNEEIKGDEEQDFLSGGKNEDDKQDGAKSTEESFDSEDVFGGGEMKPKEEPESVSLGGFVKGTLGKEKNETEESYSGKRSTKDEETKARESLFENDGDAFGDEAKVNDASKENDTDSMFESNNEEESDVDFDDSFDNDKTPKEEKQLGLFGSFKNKIVGAVNQGNKTDANLYDDDDLSEFESDI